MIVLPEYENFFALLRSALWQRPADEGRFGAFAQEAWDELWLTARRQTVAGLLFDALAALPASEKPSRAFMLKISAEVAAIENRNTKIGKALVTAARTYDQHRIPYFLLKGAAVAAAYPAPLRRTGGDIDFYLNPDDCRKAQAVLFRNATLTAKDARHFGNSLQGVHIENHFHLAHSRVKRYREFEQELLSDAIRLPLAEIEVEGYPVKCASPTFQALFMLEHMAFHLPTGLGLRQLCDWARYLCFYSERIDRTAAARIIRKYRFERIATVFSILCIDFLGMEPQYALLTVERTECAKRDTAYVMRSIMEGGNFGHHFDTLHSSLRHQRLPAWLRKPITFCILLRNRRKYELIGPGLWRKTIWRSFVRQW